MMKVSQQQLKKTFPVLFNDGRRSGNRVIDPIGRLSPFFESIYDLERCEQGMKLITSTLQNNSCSYPSFYDYVSDPILERYHERLKCAIAIDDPFIHEDALLDYFDLMAAFNALQEPRGRGDFPRRPLYPHVHDRGLGLGPRLDLLFREMALRFMPRIAAAGPDAVFEHIYHHHRANGNDTLMVRRLIEDLRIEELRELYVYAHLVADFNGSILAHKIIKIINGEPADREEIIRMLQHKGLVIS